MNTVKLSNSVLNYYRNNVKGNSNISRNQAERKMTRNMHLAITQKAKGNRIWYSYGNLRFLVVGGTKVVWMENQVATNKAWHLDWDKYNQLSEELKIDKKHVKKHVEKSDANVVVESVPEVIVVERSQSQSALIKAKGLKGLGKKISKVFAKLF